jgi:hypothetical protein
MDVRPGDLVRIGFRWGGSSTCPLALVVSRNRDPSGRATYTTLVEGRRGLHTFYDYQISRVVNTAQKNL